MKIGNMPNYLVQVFRDADSAEPNETALYEGMFTVILNIAVQISFVPGVNLDDPPWPAGQKPPIDELTTPAQARWNQLINGSYSVTPDAARAGTAEQFHSPDGVGTVFYVTPERFAVFSEELTSLSDLTGGPGESPVHDDLLDRDVIAFIDGTILESPYLTPAAASIVGRSAPQSR